MFSLADSYIYYLSFFMNTGPGLQSDLSLYDVPRSIVWCRERLCVGFKRDYFIIKVTIQMAKFWVIHFY